MSDIINLNSLCRCCHAGGDYDSLEVSCWIKNVDKTYSDMLDEIFGLKLQSPSSRVSYSICDRCIIRVCDAYQFKQQVLHCEKKFNEYCNNELWIENISDNTKNAVADPEYEIKTENEVKVKFEIDDDSHMEPLENNELSEQEVKSKISEHIKSKRRKKSHISKPSKNKSTREKYEQSFVICHETTDGTTFSCKLCGGDHETEAAMKQHVLLNHSEIHCAVCMKKFNYLSKWDKHMTRHNEKKTFTCFSCHMSFESCEDKHYTCDMCKKSYLCKQILRKHIAKHLGINKVVLCDVCGGKFNDKTNMQKHKQTVHDKIRPYCCKICQKKFASQRGYLGHMVRHNPNMAAANSCDLCHKIFSCKRSLRKHVLTHSNIFICRVCKEEFNNKIDYLSHIRMHRSSPVVCVICKATFTKKYSLKKHMMIHKGEKKFPCDVCAMKFREKATMIKHKMRKHLGGYVNKCESAKDYFCDLCGNKYRHRSGLRRHKLVKHKVNGLDVKCEYVENCQ